MIMRTMMGVPHLRVMLSQPSSQPRKTMLPPLFAESTAAPSAPFDAIHIGVALLILFIVICVLVQPPAYNKKIKNNKPFKKRRW